MDETSQAPNEPVPTGARPLSECFLLAQYEGAESLPASDATGESVRQMKLSAVRTVAPFLKEWVGEMAIRAIEKDGEGPTELYGPQGFALHLMKSEYKGWDDARKRFLRRLQCTQGHTIAEDAELPGITRLGLRYVDVWHGREFDDIGRFVHWPMDPATRTPLFRTEAQDRRVRDGVISILRTRRELDAVPTHTEEGAVDPDRVATPQIRARLVIETELQLTEATPGGIRDLLLANEMLDVLHQLSKLLAWRSLTPLARVESGVFDTDESAMFAEDDQMAAGSK